MTDHGSCSHCGSPFPNHNFACPLRSSAVPTRDGAEGAGARLPLNDVRSALVNAVPITPTKPTPDAMGEREAVIEECAKIADGYHPMLYAPEQDGRHPRDSAIKSTRTDIARLIRALSRQAPHSSSEGGR